MQEIAPEKPPGWDVVEDWHTVSSDGDSQGWQYAVSFESPYWHPSNNSSTCELWILLNKIHLFVLMWRI
jgi:hypothetical protein